MRGVKYIVERSNYKQKYRHVGSYRNFGRAMAMYKAIADQQQAVRLRVEGKTHEIVWPAYQNKHRDMFIWKTHSITILKYNPSKS